MRPSQTATSELALTRVVLYRNGIGYFERSGKVAGESLRLKVRKDQVNDLLKSLAVVDRKSGKVLGVSMPLDPQSWHKLALSALTPGQGQIAQVLDGLRGTRVTVDTRSRKRFGPHRDGRAHAAAAEPRAARRGRRRDLRGPQADPARRRPAARGAALEGAERSRSRTATW